MLTNLRPANECHSNTASKAHLNNISVWIKPLKKISGCETIPKLYGKTSPNMEYLPRKIPGHIRVVGVCVEIVRPERHSFNTVRATGCTKGHFETIYCYHWEKDLPHYFLLAGAFLYLLSCLLSCICSLFPDPRFSTSLLPANVQ